MATKTLIPSTIYNAASSYLTITNQSNAYTDTSSTTYATIQNTNASTNSRYIYIRGFDFSQVPATATVNSFTIKVKGNQTGGYSQGLSVCNGTTTISGTTASPLTNTVGTKTFSNGSLTWEKMSGYGSDFGIRINCRRNSKNTPATYYIYGAEIDVDYTEAVPSNDALYIKQNGSWVEATEVYKKVNGSWVEQNDLTQVFESGTNYKVSS